MNEPSPYFIARQAPPPEGVFHHDESNRDLRTYWWTVRKHLGLVLAIPLALAALTTVHDLMATRLYTAEASVLIQSSAPKIFDQNSLGVEPGLNPDTPVDPVLFQKTQYELLRSRSLAARVIAAEKLADNPAFAAVRRPPSKNSQGRVGEALVDAYLSDLKITPVEDTALVRISFTTVNRDLAARLANAHVREFISQRAELNSQTSEEAERFLERKLVELKRQVEASEVAANNYRRQKDLIPGLISMGTKQDVVVERLDKLSEQLQDAHLSSIGLGTQVALINGGQVNALPAVINSVLIQNLKGQLDRLQAQYASMASELKPAYPPVQDLQAKINRTASLLRQETARVAASVRARYSAALNKEKALQEDLDAEKKFALGLNDAAVQYAILERDADTNRQLYDAVLKRMKDVSVVAGVHSSNVSIIDSAVPPIAPSSPRQLIDLLVALTLGVAAGVGVAFLLEHLDTTLKTATEAQKYLRLPNLGVIPQWQGLVSKSEKSRVPIPFGQSGSSDGKVVSSRIGYSSAQEGYRSLRAALLLSRADGPPRTILITSAHAREGKTVTAVNTAISLTHISSKVLLVDADLRRPSCHKILSIKNHRGLTEILAGQSDVYSLVRDTPVSGMSFLGSGKIPPNAAELFASMRMREVLLGLAARYDFIVIDTPPLLLTSDALLLGSLADGAVLVVDASVTPRQDVREAIARLMYARVKIFGTLLNKVKPNGAGYAYYGAQHHYHPGQPDEDEDEDADLVNTQTSL